MSMEYKSIIHLCLCGCGKKVVTPLSPTGWKMTFDGKTITVYPSIGNWSLSCRSHYWITNSQVEWAKQWSQERIDAGFAHNAELKRAYYEDKEPTGPETPAPGTNDAVAHPARREGGWTRLKARLVRYLS